MKMVIVQTEKKSAIALRDDGTFIKIPQRGYSVGQAVESLSAPKSFMRFSRTAIAAAIVMVLIGCSGIMAAFMPYSYVTMDVNPSVKYTLNTFDRVLSVDAVNEDAGAIVEELNKEGVGYQKISDVIELTITQCRDSGYVSERAEDYVVLSVMSVSSGKTAKLADKLGGNHFGGGFVSAKIVSSTINNMKQAAKKGTTPGKLMIIREMQEKTGDKKPAEDWISVPVRDIMNAGNGHEGKHSGSSSDNESQSHGRKQSTSKDEDLSQKDILTPVDSSVEASGIEAAKNTPASVSTRSDENGQLQKTSPKSNSKLSSKGDEPIPTQASDTSSEETASAEQERSQRKEMPPGQEIPQEQDTSPGQEASHRKETPPGLETSQEQDTAPEQEHSQEQETPAGQEATEQNKPSSDSCEEKPGKTSEEPEQDTISSDDSKEAGGQQSNEASKN